MDTDENGNNVIPCKMIYHMIQKMKQYKLKIGLIFENAGVYYFVYIYVQEISKYPYIGYSGWSVNHARCAADLIRNPMV